MRSRIIVSLVLLAINLCSSVGVDYYEILGVSRTADLKEIRKAFKKLAVTEHPDKNNDDPEAHEAFIKLTKAYEILKDPVLRKRYDTYGVEGLENNGKREQDFFWNSYSNSFKVYDESQWIINLKENDYYENVFSAKRMWLINFYSPRCSHCHRLVSIWNKIAEEFDGAVKVGVVNCEEEWQFCRQFGIRSYPTIIHHPKKSKHRVQYTGEKSYEPIVNFILSKLEIDIQEINEPLANLISRGNNLTMKSMLIFVCGTHRNCFTSTERRKIAAIFEDSVAVKIHFCNPEEKCKNVVSEDVGVIYLSTGVDNSWHVVPLEDVHDTETLVKEIIAKLPISKESDYDELQNISQYMSGGKISDSTWLLCLYIGTMTELDTTMKRLSIMLDNIKLGKIHCGRHSHMCNGLGVNRYPMWVVLKPGGALEWYHGNNKLHDIAAFAQSSSKAKNVRTLDAEKIGNIMEGNDVNQVWFLDWYVPWCPPCLHFLKEVRKASTKLDESIVRFGIIDCTVHNKICQRYNIQSYPTAMLVNSSNVYKFTMEKVADNIVHFVNEMHSPTIIKLNSGNFRHHLDQRRERRLIYVIDYFAPWCAPCHRLAPEWIAVANALITLPFVKVASVDCEADNSLCMSEGIQSYPTIRLYFNDNRDSSTTFIPYSGQRDSVSILRWIIQYLPRRVRGLNPPILKEEVLRDQNVWVVDYSVPWCEECRRLEPQLAIVAQLLKKSVQFGVIDCNVYGAECANARVTQYPTLIAYDGRRGRKVLTNGHRVNGTTAEDIKSSILDFLADVVHDEL